MSNNLRFQTQSSQPTSWEGAAGIDILFPSNGLPETISGLRYPANGWETVTFLKKFIRTLRNCRSVRLNLDSEVSILRQALPPLLISRFLGKRIIVHYKRNQLETDLEQYGWWLLPVLRLCDRVVVSSRFAAELLGRYGVTTVVIPPAVDPDLLERRLVSHIQPKVIVARSLQSRNNVACIIEAMARVKQKYPRAELIICGDGPRRADLQRLVRSLKQNGVTFMGRVDGREQARCLDEADLYVNASSVDGLPESLIQALTAGLPVVTTDAGGISEVVTDGDNGLIVKSHDPAGLAECIIQLVESPALAERLSRNASRSVADCLQSVIEKKWRELYESPGDAGRSVQTQRQSTGHAVRPVDP
ncbi:MAG: glycosyltransferase family 4 protein [bacterium]